MDEKVKKIQERLRAELDQPLILGPQFKDLPLVSFEQLSSAPLGAETLVYKVIAELRSRGYRVANIRNYNVNTTPEHLKEIALPYFQAHSNASLFVAPDRMVQAKQLERNATLDDMISMLGNDYDVIITESFGFVSIPKFLVTDRPQEGFNLGLPNIIGYVSERDMKAMIPRFSPRDIEAIADKIESHVIEPCFHDKCCISVNGTCLKLSDEQIEQISDVLSDITKRSGMTEPIKTLEIKMSYPLDSDKEQKDYTIDEEVIGLPNILAPACEAE